MKTQDKDIKLAGLSDSVDWLWDMRHHDSLLEMGWFFLVIFSVLGSTGKEADLSWGRGVWLQLYLLFRHL